eukprot:scaffold35603_cov144-Skeletonema_dohrnii-CCMP3373.AAC.1
MVILKLSRSRSTAHKNTAEEAQKHERLREEQSGLVTEYFRSEEADDYAMYYMGKLVDSCLGVYEFAASGACLDIRDGPEVESKDEREGNQTAKAYMQNTQ